MWTYQGQPVTEAVIGDNFGFIYEITCLENGRSYIGRKYLTKAGTKQIKGKTKKVRKPSGWETYWGSCKELVDLVKELGEDKFKREILCFCKTKGSTNYQEAKIQFDRNVLEEKLPSGEWKYFNGILNVRIGRAAAGIK
jgi:hypothetical protein